MFTYVFWEKCVHALGKRFCNWKLNFLCYSQHNALHMFCNKLHLHIICLSFQCVCVHVAFLSWVTTSSDSATHDWKGVTRVMRLRFTKNHKTNHRHDWRGVSHPLHLKCSFLFGPLNNKGTKSVVWFDMNNCWATLWSGFTVSQHNLPPSYHLHPFSSLSLSLPNPEAWK